MLRNILAVAAVAFVVFGAAASLKTFKATESRDDGAIAAVRTLEDKVDDLRMEQVRQETALTMQQMTIRDLKYQLGAYAQRLTSDAAGEPEPALDIGIDALPAERAAIVGDYHAAWLHILELEEALSAATQRQGDLETALAAQLQRLENEKAEAVDQVRAEATEKYARLENEMQFVVTRLEEEIAQRDSSIISLMHRLAGTQASAPAPAKPAGTGTTLAATGQ